MQEELGEARREARQSFYAKQQLIASAKSVFQQVAAVVRAATVYPTAHPFLLASADQLLVKINELLLSRKEVAFYMVAGELFFETHSVPVDQSQSMLMEQFVARDVGSVIFTPGITRDEVVLFANLMNKDTAYFNEQGGVAGVIAKENITHIVLHRVILVDKKRGSAIKAAKKKSNEVFKEAIDTVKEMVQSVHLDKAVNMRKVSSMVHSMVDDILENRDAMMGLTNIKMYDEYTFAHSVNVSVLAISLGSYLSFEKQQIAALGIAGMMHDIGKVSIPLEIINKPDKLTDEEFEIIRRHPVEGALILADVPAMTKLAMVAAFEHHQHGGIRGYPRMDDLVQMHPFSEIVAMADVYDAIIAARVYYKVATPPDQAIRIMLKKRGTAFNPVLVKAFINMIGIYPVGTLLKLDTGEIGIVTHQTRDLLRPRVLLLTKFDGSEKDSGIEVSLLETEGGRPKRSIFGTIDPNLAKIDVKQYLE